MPSFCKAMSIIISPHNYAPLPQSSARPTNIWVSAYPHDATFCWPCGILLLFGLALEHDLVLCNKAHEREALCALPLRVGAEQEVLCTPSFSVRAKLVNISVAWQMFSNYWQGLFVCLFFPVPFCPRVRITVTQLWFRMSVANICVCVMGRALGVGGNYNVFRENRRGCDTGWCNVVLQMPRRVTLCWLYQ